MVSRTSNAPQRINIFDDGSMNNQTHGLHFLNYAYSPKTRREGNVLVKFFSHFIKKNLKVWGTLSWLLHIHTHFLCPTIKKEKWTHWAFFFPVQSLFFSPGHLHPGTVSFIEIKGLHIGWVPKFCTYQLCDLSKSLKFQSLSFLCGKQEWWSDLHKWCWGLNGMRDVNIPWKLYNVR